MCNFEHCVCLQKRSWLKGTANRVRSFKRSSYSSAARDCTDLFCAGSKIMKNGRWKFSFIAGVLQHLPFSVIEIIPPAIWFSSTSAPSNHCFISEISKRIFCDHESKNWDMSVTISARIPDGLARKLTTAARATDRKPCYFHRYWERCYDFANWSPERCL